MTRHRWQQRRWLSSSCSSHHGGFLLLVLLLGLLFSLLPEHDVLDKLGHFNLELLNGGLAVLEGEVEGLFGREW